MIKYYGANKSGCDGASCCYFDGYGLLVERREVERLIDAVKNKPDDFLLEYLPEIRKIVEEKKFFKCEGRQIRLDRDKSRPMIEFCMTSYYPCFFFKKKDRLSTCIVYPYRFKICRDTGCDDCYKNQKQSKKSRYLPII